jgi:hypothetical protein
MDLCSCLRRTPAQEFVPGYILDFVDRCIRHVTTKKERRDLRPSLTQFHVHAPSVILLIAQQTGVGEFRPSFL